MVAESILKLLTEESGIYVMETELTGRLCCTAILCRKLEFGCTTST